MDKSIIQATKNGISYCYSAPTGHELGYAVFTHGYAEHSRRYDHLFQFFTSLSWGLITYDVRGHGDSEGQRGHIEHFDLYVVDLDMIVKEGEQLYPQKPCALVAHSNGGLITAYYLTKHQKSVSTLFPNIKCIILCAPFFLD